MTKIFIINENNKHINYNGIRKPNMDKKDKITPALFQEHRTVRGFTAIELVIVILIGGILVLAINPFLRANLQAYMEARAGKEVLQTARIGFNRMISEIRRMQYTDLDGITSTSITFMGRNADGTPFTADDVFSYDLGTKQVWRNNVCLIKDVTAFSITGYKSDNTTTTWDETLVWRIKISMTVGHGPASCTFNEEIFPKGLPLDVW
jgi:prepilin-type N-terminal cleavage/methylation domain-containing protein